MRLNILRYPGQPLCPQEIKQKVKNDLLHHIRVWRVGNHDTRSPRARKEGVLRLLGQQVALSRLCARLLAVSRGPAAHG